MGDNLADMLAYEAALMHETKMLDREDFAAHKQYEILDRDEIAKRIHAEPGKSVVFALFYEQDESGTVLGESLDAWFSLSLQPNYGWRGKYVLLVGKSGDNVAVDVGKKLVGFMPTMDDVQETVRRIFYDFKFGEDLFCVCTQGEEHGK